MLLSFDYPLVFSTIILFLTNCQAKSKNSDNIDILRIRSQLDHLNSVRQGLTMLENKTLVVSVVVRQPFVSYNEPTSASYNITPRHKLSGSAINDLDNYNGIAIEVVKRLVDIFKFKVLVTRTRDNQFGVQGPDGRWTGLIASLLRNESDLAVTALSITAKRARYVDFTRAYYVETASILLKMPDEEQNFFVVLEPFSPTVWFVLMAFIVILIILIAIMTKLEDSQRKQHKLHKLSKRFRRRRQQLKNFAASDSTRHGSNDSDSSDSGNNNSDSSNSDISTKNGKLMHRNQGIKLRSHKRKSFGSSLANMELEYEIAVINHLEAASLEFGRTWTDRFYYSVSCVLNILLNKGKVELFDTI